MESEKKLHLKTNFGIVCSRMMCERTNEPTNRSVCQEMSVLWLVAVAVAVVVATVVMTGMIDTAVYVVWCSSTA